MVERNTKKRILKAAGTLANERGFGNLPLQSIADEVGMSSGNLAYHFRNKEAIALGLQSEIEESLQEVLKTYRILPNLLDFDQQLQKWYFFLEEYPFYFRDLAEFDRLLPETKALRQSWVDKIIQQFHQRLLFNAQRGIFLQEESPGAYQQLSICIWAQVLAWPGLCQTKAVQPDSAAFKSLIWRILTSLLTKEGLVEYNMLILPVLSKPSN
ncbi:MAG: TetR/AcrR family transcriptional regulator [Bacteroidota bacterium]